MSNQRQIRTTVICLAALALVIYLVFIASGIFGQ